MILPTLKQLHYLVSLHEHQHFGRAAEACNVTQSTLSAGLKELEAVLRARLVERGGKVTVFTPIGLRTAARARELLARARELAELPLDGAPLAGRLRLGVIPTIAPFLLPRVLPALGRSYPQLEVQVYEEPSHAACEALVRGARECVLLALPYTFPQIDHATLFEDPLVLAMPAREAPPEGERMDPLNLPAGRLLLLDDGHCLREHALGACDRSDLEGRNVRSGSLHTLVQLVHAGLGYTLLPKIAVDSGLTDRTTVVTRPLASAEAHRTVALAWRRNSPRAEQFLRLSETMRQASENVTPAAGTYPAPPDRRLRG